MNVVTSAKIRRDLREYLSNTYPDLTFYFHTKITEAEQDLDKADILITYGEDLSDEHIYEAKQLKWIMVMSAGLDEMPFHAIEKKGVIVTNAKGIHATPMGEYTISAMLQVARETKKINENEQLKNWDRPKMLELNGKTIGILGAGAIGQEVARLAKAFNMNVIGLNRSGQDVANFDRIVTYNNFTNILEEADYVVSILPKTKETDQLLAKEQFELMKNEAVLINIGRGNVINEDDLLHALKEGQIKHAVLDVYNQEPLPTDHPFWETENITVTPHISGVSPQYQPRALVIFEKNLEVLMSGKGEFINLIDPAKGY